MKTSDRISKLCGLVLVLVATATIAAPPSLPPPSAPGSAGGMSDPLRIKQVKMVFGFGESGQPRKTFASDEPVAGFGATFYYTGAGTVTGRWEVVEPGEALPSTLHLMVESELPGLSRANLTKYKVIDTFIESFPATGRHFLTGPDPAKLPRDFPGNYRILLRIESVSSVTIRNPPQSGLILPTLQYTIQGVRSVGKKK